jgi:hypothetical protein
MMADASAAPPPACADVPSPSPPETVPLAAGHDAPRDARQRRCPQARPRPRGQASWPRSSRYAALPEPYRVGPPGRCGTDFWLRPVHRRPARPQAVPPGRLESPRSYAHAGSADGAVAHSLRLVIHLAVHKRPRVPCRGWPGRARLPVRAEGVRSGRGVVPPEWEECGGHQAGAEARLAEQAGKRL